MKTKQLELNNQLQAKQSDMMQIETQCVCIRYFDIGETINLLIINYRLSFHHA